MITTNLSFGDRAALTATVISYRPKSAIRDVGKALGFDLETVDAIAKGQQWFDGGDVRLERFDELGMSVEDLAVRQLIVLTTQLIGFPRHLSQHTGGFVLTKDLLCRMVPVENASMPDRTVIEWDKDDLDAAGLLKVDVLALGMLSAIRRALDMIGQRRGYEFGMQDIPAEDSATYDMVCKADTIGVFQIESRAQMSMLPRLRPRCFYDLVIEVAIVRPGPIQGGMVHPYLNRRQGKEPVTYPSEALKTALGRTLGVPVFQEQVMQISILAAGFTPGEADGLRRAMAAWKRKGGLGKYYNKIVDGMTSRGYLVALESQLVGQYMRHRKATIGFLVLVLQTKGREWTDPATKKMLNFQQVLAILSAKAQELEAKDRTRYLRVIGIDATTPEDFRAATKKAHANKHNKKK